MLVLLQAFLTSCMPEKSMLTGSWSLETVAAADGSTLAVGEAYEGYDAFDGDKRAIRATFWEDGTMKMTEESSERTGKYSLVPGQNLDPGKEDAGSTAWVVTFDDGAHMDAVCGVRSVSDKSIATLLLTDKEWIYMFLKME